MVDVLALLAFTALIAGQFLAVVFAYRFHHRAESAQATDTRPVSLIHRAA